MENLTKAIVAASAQIKGIEKSLTVGYGKNSYKGIADKDVKNIVGKAMQEHGLSLVPTEIDQKTDIIRWEESYQGVAKQKMQVFVEVKCKYKLLHTSGESIDVVGYGHGIDTQDKAAGKATTYALKYAMLYIFQVATGSIDDTDTEHSEEKATPQKIVLTVNHPHYAAIKEKIKNKSATIEQVEQHYTMKQDVKILLTNVLKEG